MIRLAVILMILGVALFFGNALAGMATFAWMRAGMIKDGPVPKWLWLTLPIGPGLILIGATIAGLLVLYSSVDAPRDASGF